MHGNTVNDQILDSVTSNHLLTIGSASAQSLAIVEAVGSETIGASMHNAVRAQQNAQMLTSAAVAAACARIVGAEAAPIATPLKPPTDDAVPVDNEPVVPFDPTATAAARTAAAVQNLTVLRDRGQQQAKDAADALDRITSIASHDPADSDHAEGAADHDAPEHDRDTPDEEPRPAGDDVSPGDDSRSTDDEGTQSRARRLHGGEDAKGDS